MFGTILSGGQSLRMGRDKGLIKTARNLAWVQQSFSLLSQFCPRVLVSINKSQLENYQALFAHDQLVIDNDEISAKGPLLGLLSMHAQYPEHDIFLLACDLQNMNGTVLECLSDNYKKFKNQEAYIFLNEEHPEPLCAIYSAKALTRLLAAYLNKEQKNFSMKRALEQLSIHKISVPEQWKPFFLNINTAAELGRLQRSFIDW